MAVRVKSYVHILVNGAGGNNPKGSTSRDNLTPEEVAELDEKGVIEGIKTFFDLDPEGISFVFNLNFLGTLIPTQVFARDWREKAARSSTYLR